MQPTDFPRLAMAIFEYQRRHNPVYASFLQLSNQQHLSPNNWEDIPCLPIALFRHHEVKTGDWQTATTFESSGTTGIFSSRHHVRSLHDYQLGCIRAFEAHVAPLATFQLSALLPSYQEKGNSGLLAMIDSFIQRAAPGSQYLKHDGRSIHDAIRLAFAKTQPMLLWGVSYALLDVVEQGKLVLPKGSIVMETGGMKGRREELTRHSLHEKLRAGMRLEDGSPVVILSEYGMTEMSSQAYFLEDQRFHPASSLRVLTRDVTDPFSLRQNGKSGAINVYDLGNVDTCSFIQTDDLGIVYPDGSFDVLGRLDHSIVRGCNLLVADL